MAKKSRPNVDSRRSQAGRVGAYTMLSRNDPKHTTKNGRAAFLAKFEQEVDPDRQLAAEERARRASAARRAHFARLALASAKARSMRRSRQQTDEG
jgi:hypothetical protein